MWPPVSRFGALLCPRQGIYCLKVCNALARVLGAFSARSGFGPFLHPAACFGILLRPSRCTRSDKPPRWRESGATGPSFSPPPRTPQSISRIDASYLRFDGEPSGWALRGGIPSPHRTCQQASARSGRGRSWGLSW